MVISPSGHSCRYSVEESHLTKSSDEDINFSLLFFDFFLTCTISSSPVLSGVNWNKSYSIHGVFSCKCFVFPTHISVATLRGFTVVQHAQLRLHRLAHLLERSSNHFRIWKHENRPHNIKHARTLRKVNWKMCNVRPIPSSAYSFLDEEALDSTFDFFFLTSSPESLLFRRFSLRQQEEHNYNTISFWSLKSTFLVLFLLLSGMTKLAGVAVITMTTIHPVITRLSLKQNKKIYIYYCKFW